MVIPTIEHTQDRCKTALIYAKVLLNAERKIVCSSKSEPQI
jgi:hypothetical protein